MTTETKIERILLFGREFDESFKPAFLKLLGKLQAYSVECYVFEPFLKFLKERLLLDPRFDGVFSGHDEIAGEHQLMLSIGGDGTFLEAITLVREKKIPIAGINSGRLGFLAAISQEEIQVAIDTLMQGEYDEEERTLLTVSCDHPLFGDFNYALNEITVLKRDDSSMITIDAWLDDRFLNTYWADGLIVSTPTGSTAYSLSVGGPLVLPGTGTIVLAPIAPHNLTVRPLVYQDSLTLRLKVKGRSKHLLVSADSRSVVIEDKMELSISKAPFTITTPRLKDQNYYETLRNKLMWGADRRN